jgi:hypothetical protein
MAATPWCFPFAGSVTNLSDQLSSVTFGTNAGTGQNVAMIRVAKYPTPLVPRRRRPPTPRSGTPSNPNFTPASTPLAVNASSYKGAAAVPSVRAGPATT